MPEEPGSADARGEQRDELLARLRAVVEAKDAQIVVLQARLDAEQEARRRLELRLEELERRLGSDSSDSGISHGHTLSTRRHQNGGIVSGATG